MNDNRTKEDRLIAISLAPHAALEGLGTPAELLSALRAGLAPAIIPEQALTLPNEIGSM